MLGFFPSLTDSHNPLQISLGSFSVVNHLPGMFGLESALGRAGPQMYLETPEPSCVNPHNSSVWELAWLSQKHVAQIICIPTHPAPSFTPDQGPGSFSRLGPVKEGNQHVSDCLPLSIRILIPVLSSHPSF